jgi:hypothetical protein
MPLQKQISPKLSLARAFLRCAEENKQKVIFNDDKNLTFGFTEVFGPTVIKYEFTLLEKRPTAETGSISTDPNLIRNVIYSYDSTPEAERSGLDKEICTSLIFNETHVLEDPKNKVTLYTFSNNANIPVLQMKIILN